MIKLLSFLLCLVSLSLWAHAQSDGRESALLSMVETERAFSSMSREKGTQPSFLAFIAEDGILFRPKAVKGKKWMLDHPTPASDKRPLLSWEPIQAEMASAGDMGYTFGPWQFRNNINDEKAVAWGHFITIWKKQADGTWKFVVDLGISHPEPRHISSISSTPQDQAQSKMLGVKIDAERAALLSAEQTFSKDSEDHGARKAFTTRATSSVTVFRENQFPFSAIAAASEAVPAGAGLWTWKPEGWDVSRSGDLGYSYGTYWLKSSEAKTQPETGNYFRIWKKQGNVWKVVVDVANPVPEKKS
jgi:ketosteroid isomerase-like protein